VFREFLSLIEPALTPAPAMERYRDDEVDVEQEIAGSPDHQPGERLGE
jgi:hypothetical protein